MVSYVSTWYGSINKLITITVWLYFEYLLYVLKCRQNKFGVEASRGIYVGLFFMYTTFCLFYLVLFYCLFVFCSFVVVVILLFFLCVFFYPEPYTPRYAATTYNVIDLSPTLTLSSFVYFMVVI